MSGPGKGRYTDYITVQSSRNNRLRRSFNSNPMANEKGEIYGVDQSNQSDNSKIAKFVSDKYNARIPEDYGYKQIKFYSQGENSSFVYFALSAPDTSKLSSDIEGPPSNPYIPDLNSPGANAGTGEITSTPYVNFNKQFNPAIDSIDPKDYKPYFINISPSSADNKDELGTLSPVVSSEVVGLSSVGANLTFGSSKRS